MSTYIVRCREAQGRTYDYPVATGAKGVEVVSFADGEARLDEHDPRLDVFRSNPRYFVTAASDQPAEEPA